jgi:hypothetical protein
MLRSFIVRVYRPARKRVPGTALRGVVENAGHEQQPFRSLDELARILETDAPGGKTTKRRHR